MACKKHFAEAVGYENNPVIQRNNNFSDSAKNRSHHYIQPDVKYGRYPRKFTKEFPVPKKQMSPLVRTLCVVLGLVVAEAVLPVAVALPFALHENAMAKKVQAKHLDGDKVRLTQVFKMFQSYESTRREDSTLADKSLTNYRQTLVQAANDMKTDIGALCLSEILIVYLADHPDDKALQDLGIAMVDRGLAYNAKTFTPIYERVDRIDSILELSLPVRLYAKQTRDLKNRGRTVIPMRLIEEKAGLLNPQQFLAEKRKNQVEILQSPQASPPPDKGTATATK